MLDDDEEYTTIITEEEGVVGDRGYGKKIHYDTEDLRDDRIENCVCYWRLALQKKDGTIVPIRLNLPRIFRETRHQWPIFYDPQQFGSANIRIAHRSLGFKHVAVLIFSTGKVVCPGSSSRSSAIVMAHIITNEVSRVLKAPLCMRGFVMPNIVCTIHLHPINLINMAKVLGKPLARYDPNGPRPFPACFIFPHEIDNVVYLVFSSGKVVITGCRSESDAKKNMHEARELCTQFPKHAQDVSDERLIALFNVNAALEEPSGLNAIMSRISSEHPENSIKKIQRPVFSTGFQYMIESSSIHKNPS